MLKQTCLFVIFAAALLAACPSIAQLPQPNGGHLERGVLPTHWLSQGNKCMEIPDWEVHEYNKDLYILRQSPCTDFEKPLIYLFFGKDKALLADTGSANGNLVPFLRETMNRWLARNHRTSIPLNRYAYPFARRPYMGRQGRPGHERSCDSGHLRGCYYPGTNEFFRLQEVALGRC